MFLFAVCVFFVVWAFPFFCCCLGACFFFGCLGGGGGGGGGPAQTAKKTHDPPPKNIKKRARPRPVHHLATAKNEIQKTTHTPAQTELFGWVSRDVGFAVWAGTGLGLSLFLFFLLCGDVLFCVYCLGVVCVFFLLFGRGWCSIFAVWARTGVHLLSGLPGST